MQIYSLNEVNNLYPVRTKANAVFVCQLFRGRAYLGKVFRSASNDSKFLGEIELESPGRPCAEDEEGYGNGFFGSVAFGPNAAISISGGGCIFSKSKRSKINNNKWNKYLLSTRNKGQECKYF